MKTRAGTLIPLVCCALLTACATRTLPTSQGHISETAPAGGSIPEPVQQSTALRPPTATPKLETYSVTVHKVPVQSLLFALARDAGMNIDVHPGLQGTVTLNAIDQTLPQLLTRIARQVDMRFEIDGKNLVVQPDQPMWRNYKVDYVNIARSTTGSVNIATQISNTGGGSANSNSSNNSNNGNNSNGGNNSNNNGGGSGNNNGNGNNNNNNGNNNQNNQAPVSNNNSTTSVSNRSDNNFWASLERNIRDMLQDGEAASGAAGAGVAAQPPGAPQMPAGAQSGDAPAVIVNAEAGVIAVRANSRQQEKVQAFLDLVLHSAKRQVLIEATILEVRLSDQYQQGINWQRLGGALSLTQGQVGTAALSSGVVPGSTVGMFLGSYANGNFSSTVQLLESFGKVKVLSSPKISVLNNQTALLKVVDNNVYFTITVTPAVISSTGAITTPTTYESKLETVPVGFVMSVTPQISDNDEVTLNVRPTITRIVGYVRDPNPALGTVVSQVPVIQSRELESIMKVSNGQTAVMGGLMQDSVDNAKDGVPGLASLPLVGNLFTYRNEQSSKTELVIFMRPVVVKDASINGDYKDYRYLLPTPEPINSDPYFDLKTAPSPHAPARPAGGN